MRALIGVSVLWFAMSAISDGVTTLVLPVRLASGTKTSESLLGLIGTGGLLVGLIVQPFAGAASDRMRARLGRLGVAGLGVALTVAALGGIAVVADPAAVALSFAALCLGLAVTQAPQQAIAADVIPSGRFGRAAGAKGFADLLGSVLGFALLGPLLASGQVAPGLAFLAAVVAASFGLVVLLVGRADRRGPTPIAERDPGGSSTSTGLWAAIVSRLLFLVGIYAVGRFLVPFVAFRLHLEIGPAADAAGNLLAFLALVTALGSLVAGFASDRVPGRVLTAGGAALAMAGIAVIAVGPTLDVITAGGVAMAAGTAAFVTANWRRLLEISAGPSAGRLLGVANIGTAGGAVLAGLAGPVIDAADGLSAGAGYPVMFGIAIVAIGASALVGAPQLVGRVQPTAAAA